MIINADFRTIAPLFGPGSVDLIITDPPYRSISGGNAGRDGQPAGILSPRDGGVSYDGQFFDDNATEAHEYLPDLFHVLTDPGHLYLFTNWLNLRRFCIALEDAGFRIHTLLFWGKNNATPGRWYMGNVEIVIFAYKGRARGIYTPGEKRLIMADNPASPKHHPTEKPVDLLRRYVCASSRPGELVLDPFAGSGSTGVAALAEERRFIGVEINPEFARVAKERLVNGT